MSARVKVLRGYTAHARWLARVTEGPEIERPADLPREPYRFSREVATYVDQHGRSVVCLETAHLRFEVWTVAR